MKVKKNFPENISKVSELNRLLQQVGGSYLIEGKLPDKQVSAKFEGVFEESVVVWNAVVMTMDCYAEQHSVCKDPKQFIDISCHEGVYHLLVALNLPEINQAVIESTIIMIRKYKRLKSGRHEYGARSKTQ